MLVVDDDRPFREAVAGVLEAHGFCVVQAADGKEALARLRTEPRPAVVLLDLIMPGVDGTAFRSAQLADRDTAAVPVVLCSGESNLAVHAARLGVRDFVRKPIDLERLLGFVTTHAESRPPGSTSADAGTGASAVSALPGCARQDRVAPDPAVRPAEPRRDRRRVSPRQ